MNKKNYTDQNKQVSLLWRIILWRGIREFCPQCGKGKIFKSYLKQVEYCPSCQENISALQADDGPAWLIILVIGHILYCILCSKRNIAAVAFDGNFVRTNNYIGMFSSTALQRFVHRCTLVDQK